MKNFFMKTLQAALNHFVTLDPESLTKLIRLNDKVIAIELLGINLNFQLHFKENKILLLHQHFLKADTTIKGTPLRLLQMSLSKDKHSFFADDVSIEGDLELGQQVLSLFDQLEIDREEYLSRWVSDVPAHHIGNFARGLKKWAQKTRQTLYENVSEYTHEEAEFVPAKEALQDFFEDIDEIRMDGDRLESRIQLLEKSIRSKRGLQ